MNMDIKRKVALITGASAGIGAATAIEFAKHGVKVAITGRNAENLDKTAKLCQQAGLKESEVFQYLGDVTEKEICEEIVDKTLNHFGELDILVNNAGATQRIPVLDLKSEDLDKMLDLHVKAPFNITQRAIPAIIKSKGTIVNVSSRFALKPSTKAPAYSMAKASQDHYTKILALELADKGVTVNAVCPGVVMTNVLGDIDSEKSVFGGMTARQALTHMAEVSHPNKRAVQPEEVAKTILFLASTAAEMINGALIPIDGASYIS